MRAPAPVPFPRLWSCEHREAARRGPPSAVMSSADSEGGLWRTTIVWHRVSQVLNLEGFRHPRGRLHTLISHPALPNRVSDSRPSQMARDQGRRVTFSPALFSTASHLGLLNVFGDCLLHSGRCCCPGRSLHHCSRRGSHRTASQVVTPPAASACQGHPSRCHESGFSKMQI